MNLEDLTLDKVIDNELNIGDSICMDDIIDNREDNQSDNLILNETDANRFIMELINDLSIDEGWWEIQGQHIRDDVQYQLRNFGEVDLEELEEFYGSIVLKLYKKYFGDDLIENKRN